MVISLELHGREHRRRAQERLYGAVDNDDDHEEQAGTAERTLEGLVDQWRDEAGS
jgi:hypothetical protein